MFVSPADERYDGEWHMHCLPWNLMVASGLDTDLVTSFTGSVEQSVHQGGYGTWANDVNDQDATIFHIVLQMMIT